jgi:hypothetical protein
VLREQRGHVPGAAAEVHDERRVRRMDLGQQVEERPGPLAAEPQVDSRIPISSSSFSISTYCQIGCCRRDAAHPPALYGWITV